MKYNKDNIIYIDFTFKRKKINSKPHLFLYKLYSRLIKIFPFIKIKINLYTQTEKHQIINFYYPIIIFK